MAAEGVTLIRRMAAGDREAFAAFYDAYAPLAFGIVRRMLTDGDEAADVLQEVFVAAHTAMLADERAITARPWLYRIARNRCLNHLRRQVPEGQDSMDVHPYENGATTLERRNASRAWMFERCTSMTGTRGTDLRQSCRT